MARIPKQLIKQRKRLRKASAATNNRDGVRFEIQTGERFTPRGKRAILHGLLLDKKSRKKVSRVQKIITRGKK
jgi:hypothetical protein